MTKIPVHKSTGNVFRDIGFGPAEAAELTAKSMLITAIGETIQRRKITQREAADLQIRSSLLLCAARAVECGSLLPLFLRAGLRAAFQTPRTG